MRYLCRRFGHALLLLAVVSALAFVLFQLAPGSFFSTARLSPDISPETVRAWQTQYGLGLPLPQRYVRWLGSVVKGDFGPSFAYNLPAGSLLRERAANTLLLTVTAALVSWLIAVPLAVYTAVRRSPVLDRLFAGGTATLLALPELVVALAFLLLAARTGVLPVGAMKSPAFDELSLLGKLKDVVVHLLLPVATIVLGTLPVIARHAQTAVLEVLNAPLVTSARSHGLPRRVIVFRYMLRAAANPLISLLGFSIATLISGSLLVEVVMGWPGLGPLLLEAILARDLNVVLGAVMVSTAFLIAGNLAADVLLFAADPRIRGAAS